MSEPTTEDIQGFYKKRYDNPKIDVDIERSKSIVTKPSHKFQQLLMKKIHPDLNKLNFGCGSPIPSGNLTGFHVLDLGSGSGRDCFVISALSGDSGRVIGVDLSHEAIDLAKSYKDYHREAFGLRKDIVDFKQGNIEDLRPAVEDDSIDLVISNCVVNLAKNKSNVFKEVYRVLREGGEFYFSDIYTSSRLGKNVKKSKELWGNCRAGALYVSDFHHMLKRIGFSNFQIVSARVKKKSKNLESKLKDDDSSISPTFYSITLRAFKINSAFLDEGEEDYGQTATFIGGNEENDDYDFIFSYDQVFQKGIPKKVSGDTAEILKRSKYGKYFEITGGKGAHKGRFLNSMSFWEILEEVSRNSKEDNKRKCCSSSVEIPLGGNCKSGGCYL